MKLIRKLTVILAVLLISTAFVGAGSAFTYSSYDAVVSPATALMPGQSVTATMKVTIGAGSLDVSDKLTLSTPLTGAKWSTDIYRGGVVLVTGYESSSISGFMLESDSNLVLKISLSGQVSPDSVGKAISVMKITATAKEANGYSAYSSKPQMVYNPADFPTDLVSIKSDAAELGTRISMYSDYGIDTEAAAAVLNQSNVKISAAEYVGVGDLITAYVNLEAAETLLLKAERDLCLSGLKTVNTTLGTIEEAEDEFSERGWYEEALYYATKILNIQTVYESLVSTYNSGGIPDAAKMDELVADTFETLAKAEDELAGVGSMPESLTLKNGWNFVSIPKALAAGTSSASTLFGSVDTAENGILTYNASAQSWEQITASAVIKPLTGYWIYSNGTVDVPLSYVTDPSVPAVKQLYSGWNAVGVSAESAVSASSFLAGTPWRVALPWDLEAGNWNIAVVNGGSSANSAEQYLSLGNGIWVYAESEGTLIGLTA